MHNENAPFCRISEHLQLKYEHQDFIEKNFEKNLECKLLTSGKGHVE